jgi:Ca2+-binding RTX toxin-like protein
MKHAHFESLDARRLFVGFNDLTTLANALVNQDAGFGAVRPIVTLSKKGDLGVRLAGNAASRFDTLIVKRVKKKYVDVVWEQTSFFAEATSVRYYRGQLKTIRSIEVVGSFGDDNVILAGTLPPSIVLGGDGDDTLTGSNAADVLRGGDGADRLSGGSGNDTLQGEDGRDQLDGGDGEDVLQGGAGQDTLVDSKDDNLMYGGTDRDSIFARAGRDLLDKDRKNDRILWDG